MANSFPAVPGDLQLTSLVYLALLPGITIQPGSALDYGTAVNSQLVYTIPNMGASFTFTTPGSFGTFDQAAFETSLRASVTSVINVLGAMSGIAAATLQGQTQVKRTWTWTGPSGSTCEWQDNMTYP